jgi:hypothetical protein
MMSNVLGGRLLMKQIIITLFISLFAISVSYSQECVPVYDSLCATEVKHNKEIRELLKIEKYFIDSKHEYGGIVQFKLYKVSHYAEFTHLGSTYESLTALSTFSRKMLGLAQYGDDGFYNAFQMLQSVETLDRSKFDRFMDYQLSPLQDVYDDIVNHGAEYEDFLDSDLEKLYRYMNLITKAKSNLYNTLFTKPKTVAYVYDLLDNNNENHPETYITIVINNYILLINRHWQL